MNQALAAQRLQLKREREARSWEREKLVYERVLTPNVVRLALILAIISYSTWCARSKRNVGPVQSALAFAGPGIGIPIIAADAGITDKYALAAISAAGIGYTGLQSVQGWSEAGVLGDVTVLPGLSIKEISDWFSGLSAAPAASLQALLPFLPITD